MIDMLDLVLILFFGGVIVVPYALYLFTRYEAPKSTNEAFRHTSVFTLIALAVCIAMDVRDFGGSLGDWGLAYYVPAILLIALLRIALDLFFIRREAKNG